MCRVLLHSCSSPPSEKMAVSSSSSTVVQSAPMQLTTQSSSSTSLAGDEPQQPVDQALRSNGLTVRQDDAGVVIQLELNPRSRGSKQSASGCSPVAANRHECPICGKVLRNARCLRSHLKTHSGEKPYSCGECDSQFTAKCHMVIHSRIHSGERPYACNVCNKEFMQSPHLKSHMITHSDDKKFQCTSCPKTFKFKNSLKVHLREHSNVGNFVCETCEKCYPTKKRLKSHMRVHSSDRPFQCDVCDKKFKDASYVTKHKLKFCKNEGYKKRWKLYKKSMNEAKSLTTASKDVHNTNLRKAPAASLATGGSSATLTPERLTATRSIEQSAAAPAEEQPKERRSRGRPAGARNRKCRRKKKSEHTVTNDASENEFEELLNSHHEKHVSDREKLSRSTPSNELTNSGGVSEEKDDISFSCFEGLTDKTSVSSNSEVTGSDRFLQSQYSVSVLNEDNLPQDGTSSKTDLGVEENLNRRGKLQQIGSGEECLFRRKQHRDREWYDQQQPIEGNMLVQKEHGAQQPALTLQHQQQPHHLNHSHVQQQHHLLQHQQQIHQQQQRHQQFCPDSQQHKQVTHNVGLANQFQQTPVSGKVISQEQQHQQREDKGVASNYALERGCDTLPQLLPSLPETLYQENPPSALGQHQYSTSYHVPQTHHLDSHALYSYSDNIKDLFMSMLPGNYDHSLMVDGQDNAQNLTLSHEISVHGNLDNLPQNLSTIPQNLTNLSNNLPSLTDNLSGPAHSMSMTQNQNFMTLPQNLVAGGGGGSLSPLPLLTSHSQNQAPMPQNLSSIQQNPPFSQNIASDNHSSVGQDISRLAHINSHLPENAINFASQNHSHLSNSLSNGMLQNLTLPQNLSSSADTLPSLPQNLSIMTGNLTSMSANPILSQNSLPQNLTSQSVCSMPKNLTTFSHSVYNPNHHSTPQNLSCHANFSNGGHDMMPPVQDLSLPQNLSSSSSMTHLTDAQLSEEIIQPQNLSQNHMTQPENLSVPQNLTSNHGPQRRTACINQPQNLSVTNNGIAPQPMTNKDLSTPENLTCTTLQMPQNLSFHHSQNETHGLSNIQLNSNRNLNTNITRNSANFNMRSQNMSFNSNMHMPLILTQPNMTYPENLSHHNFPANQNLSMEDPFSHSLTSSDNFTLPSNVGTVHKFTGPENLSNPKLHSQTIQDLSCHSKMATPHQDNVPENLSLASCLDSQPQNLSRALQPQNLSHESKNNSTYPNDSLNSQSFAMQQPQNLTLPHNWI